MSICLEEKLSELNLNKKYLGLVKNVTRPSMMKFHFRRAKTQNACYQHLLIFLKRLQTLSLLSQPTLAE